MSLPTRKIFQLMVIGSVSFALTGCSTLIEKLYKSSSSASTSDTSCEELRDDERYQEAIDCYEKEIKKNPNETDFYDNVAYCYYQLGEYEKSIHTANRALKVNPKDDYAYDYRAASKYQMKQYNEAIEDFSKELELDPNDANAYLQRGEVFADIHQYERSLKDYSEAIDLDPNNVSGYFNRGQIYYRLGRYKEARDDFEESVKQDNEEKTHHSYLGTTFDALGDTAKAQESFAQAKKLDSTWCDSYLHTGTIDLRKGDKKAAIEQFRKLLLDKTNTFYGGIYLYLVYLFDKQPEDAKAAIKASEMLRTDDEWPWPVALYFEGKLSDTQLCLIAREGDHLTEAKCYAGVNEVLKGNKARGMELLNWVEKEGNPFMPEQRLARWGRALK